MQTRSVHDIVQLYCSLYHTVRVRGDVTGHGGYMNETKRPEPALLSLPGERRGAIDRLNALNARGAVARRDCGWSLAHDHLWWRLWLMWHMVWRKWWQGREAR